MRSLFILALLAASAVQAVPSHSVPSNPHALASHDVAKKEMKEIDNYKRGYDRCRTNGHEDKYCQQTALEWVFKTK